MFAAKENIIPHFEFICSVDQGIDVNWKVLACKSIVEKAMNDNAFHFNEHEGRILRGAKINLGLDAEDFYLADCLDLHSVELSDYGKAELIDYLADLTKGYFWYAQSVTRKQK